MPELPFRLDPAACDQCGDCVRACPLGAIELTAGFISIDPGRCDACEECALACPTTAITLVRRTGRSVRHQAAHMKDEEDGKRWRLPDLAIGLGGLVLLQFLVRLVPSQPEAGGTTRAVVLAATLLFYGLIVGLVWLLARRRHNSFADLGFARFRPLSSLLAVSGLMVVLVATRFWYVEVARMVGLEPPSVAEQVIGLFGKGPGGLVLAIAVTVVVAPVVEELFFRGFVYGALRERTRASLAIFLSSLIFAIYHFSLWLVAPIILLGVALAWLTEWQRSIWPAIICHALNNLLAVLSVYVLAGWI